MSYHSDLDAILDEWYDIEGMRQEMAEGRCGDDGDECGHCVKCDPDYEERLMENRWVRGE